jgi:small-conductance mechanosensitive channel
MLHMWQLFWPAVAFIGVSIVALLFRASLTRGLRRWLGPDSVAVFLNAIRLPSILWCLVLGLFVAIEMVEMPGRVAVQLHTILQAAIILSVTFTVAGVLGSLAASAGERRALGIGMTGLVRTAVRGTVLLIGLLVTLDAVGVEITPLLTALGVGGLAVALALQDTLSNLFAGVHLLADKPIRVGDYVKIADTIEGYVVDVGWRSTRVRMLQHNVVIVPNKRVAESIIVNYDMPERRMALLLRVGVGYASDPDRVEAALVDEARKAAGELAGLLAEPAPSAKLIPGFGEYSLDFTLVCHVASFVDQYDVQHELRKRILRRFRAEGIEIPYPIRIVESRNGGEPSTSSPPVGPPDRAV